MSQSPTHQLCDPDSKLKVAVKGIAVCTESTVPVFSHFNFSATGVCRKSAACHGRCHWGGVARGALPALVRQLPLPPRLRGFESTLW